MTDKQFPPTPSIPPLPPATLRRLTPLLQSFTLRHSTHHRPIALVTSGGTAADLEINAVRYLDNFSTGLRGAVSVEQFLRRGYAVVHLWREGSASPYGRVLGESLGVSRGNHGISCDGLGKLFRSGSDEDDVVEAVIADDVFLTGTQKKKQDAQTSKHDEDEALVLSRHVLHNSKLVRSVRERSTVLKEGRLLTVPFRTVEEYLSLLRLCCQTLRDSQSLAVVYLAAAVSDFYVPKARRSLHKIQSQDYDGVAKSREMEESGCLTLRLHPVPKLIGELRTEWAPDAFVVSFKLETDLTILRHKAMIAAKKYGVHMVIGNVLQSRHEKVWVLHGVQSGDEKKTDGGVGETVTEEGGFQFHEISKSRSGGGGDGSSGSSIDDLEDAMISFVVERHFDHIAHHYPDSPTGDKSPMMSGAEAAARNNERLVAQKKQLQRELYWKRVRDLALNVLGSAMGMALTYGISTFLQRRILRAGGAHR